MLSDIALLGTTAPDTVPSFPSKAEPGFEEAFAGLLPQLPAPIPEFDPGRAASRSTLPVPTPWIAEIPEPSVSIASEDVSSAPEDASVAPEDASVAPGVWRAVALLADVVPADAPPADTALVVVEADLPWPPEPWRRWQVGLSEDAVLVDAQPSEPVADVALESFDHVAHPFRGADPQSSETASLVENTAPTVADGITPKREGDEEEQPAPVIVATPTLALPPVEMPPVVIETPSLTEAVEADLSTSAKATADEQVGLSPSTEVVAAEVATSEAPIPANAAIDQASTPGDDIVHTADRGRPSGRPFVTEQAATPQEPVETIDALHVGHPFRGATPNRVREDSVPAAPYVGHPFRGATTAPAHDRPEEVRARLASMLATLPQVPPHASIPQQPAQVSPAIDKNTSLEFVATVSRAPEEAPAHVAQRPILEGSANQLPLDPANLRQGPPAFDFAQARKGGHYEIPIGRLETGRARMASMLATIAQMSPHAGLPRQPEQLSQLFEKNALPELVAAVRDQVAVNEPASNDRSDTYESASHQKPDPSQALARELTSLAGRVAPYEPQVIAGQADLKVGLYRTLSESEAPEAGLQFAAMPVRPMSPVLLNTVPQSPEIQPRVTLPAEAENARSIVQTLRMQAASGGGTATLTLRPEFLGSVTVSLHVKEGGVVATMQAENSAVRSWIESNVQILRDGLAEQGLKLEQVIVSERQAPDLPEDARRDRQAGEQTPQRRMRRRDDRTFEVIA